MADTMVGMPARQETQWERLMRLGRERREAFRKKLCMKPHYDTTYHLISRGTSAGYDKHLLVTQAGWVDLFKFYAAEDDESGNTDLSGVFSLSPAEFRGVVLAYAKQHPDIVEMLQDAQDTGYDLPEADAALVEARDLRVVHGAGVDQGGADVAQH